MRNLALAAAVLLAGLIACASKPETPQVLVTQGSAEMKSVLQRTISDPGRRDKLIANADGLESVLRGHAADYRAFVDEYRKLNDSYDTSAAQVEALFARFERKRQDSRARLLELHFQMIKLTSPQEWPPIAKAEGELLKSTAEVPPQ